MTFKKIFAFTLAFVLIIVSAFVVSAETPTYSESFATWDDMITVLNKYEEQYPFYEGYDFSRNSDYDEHLEFRQIIKVGVGDSDIKPLEYSFMESHYGYGVDITATTFYNADKSDRVMAMVHYGYDTSGITVKLYHAKRNENVSSFDEGVIGSREYLICRSDAYTDYYLVEGEYLIWLRAFMETDADFLKNITIDYADAIIPVRVSDNTEWFDKTIENGYVIGDANSDGVLNIRDATALQKYVARLGKVDKLMADFNGDFKINVRDATDIQKKLAGLKYTCRRELYPVTYSYLGDIETKLIESTTDYAGPFSNSELALIMHSGEDRKDYANVFNTVEEFEAFFGKTLDRYDEEFFKDNSLVYVYRWYHSSSFTWTPESVTFADGLLCVNCNYNEPKNDDMIENAISNNNLFYEVKKTDIAGLKGICVSELIEVVLD